MEKSLYNDFDKAERGNNWWFKGRKDIVVNLIKKYKGTSKEIAILDVGCGTGYILKCLKDLGYRNIEGIDISEESLRIGREKGLTIHHGGLPHGMNLSNKYDLILCLDVIEHVEDDFNSIGSIKSLLKDDGVFISTVPAFEFLWSHHDDINHHKKRYTLDGFKQLLLKNNLSILTLSYYNFILFPIAVLFKFINRKSETLSNPKGGMFNSILYFLFQSEKIILSKGLKFPFGVSIISVTKK